MQRIVVAGQKALVGILNATAIGHHSLHLCCCFGRNDAPQCGEKKFHLAEQNAAIVAVGYIVAHGVMKLMECGGDIHPMIVFVIAGHQKGVSVVAGAPIDKRMILKQEIAKQNHISCQHEDVAGHLERIFRQPLRVVGKL